MSVPSMVHRSGDSLVVRSVVSGDALFGSTDAVEDVEYSDDLPESGDDKDLPECKIRRNYSCGSCDYFTQNPRHFLYHLRDEHKEKVRIYECPNCLYASKHFQKLLRHSKMVHGGTDGVEVPDFVRSKSKKRKMPEEEPDEPLDDSMDVDEGEEEPEGSNSDKAVLKCSLCAFTARSQPQLTKHEREEHIKTKFFRCTKCTYVTHMKARFTKHVKYHSMPMIKCDMCDFRTPYKWNLDRHCKNHNGRGAFRCSACNFTADIKQSLTVHEMNHHVPPVGQAAGLGVGRRRNKVGASDSAAAEEVAQQPRTEVEPSVPTATDNNKKATDQNLKISTKKSKTANNQEQRSRDYGSDFIHPDDIIHHANGNIYIKSKCKLCNYKTAWDGEMAKHEQKVHNIIRADAPIKNVKKPSRPIPNLIPIPTQTSVIKLKPEKQPEPHVPATPVTPLEPVMSQKDMNDICAKSANSALRDFASLFGSEDVFKAIEKQEPHSPQPPASEMPELLPAIPVHTSTPKSMETSSFKEKNASFFDKLKEKLMNGAGESCNLTCQYCGHESKCLSELSGHQKTCGKEQIQAHTLTPIHNISSSRCQYCRQRCKSSTDLYNHLKTCSEAVKFVTSKLEVEVHEEELPPPPEVDIKIEEPQVSVTEVYENKPHPMENRVFVWNNIEAPLEIDEDEHHFDYVEDKQEDNVSLDLSIRTQSPGGSENSYLGAEVTHNVTSVTDKVPTHGNDISIAQVAQHKRVFKCPHCSFWASTASRFHVHIVGHLNKKPFECSLCAYKSNWRWDITKHIKLKSVRDPAHERAKVLMTDETGRRNYTKYNKYLTEIPITGDQNETSGGAGTRPKVAHDSHEPTVTPRPILPKPELPKLLRAPNSNDFSPLLRSPLRPPPPLKAADESFFAKISSEKKKSIPESKKTLWKCKMCNFRDASHEKLLAHVKGHYQQDNLQISPTVNGLGVQAVDDEASENRSRGHAPFRCGHCHQVSNWKHVIQRHCRLKHSGDIRVVIGSKNGPERMEMEEQIDEPDHVDLPQIGTFKCKQCPFSNNDHDEFEMHLNGHVPKSNSIMKCYFCTFFVTHKEDLHDHLKLHGINEPEEYMSKMLEKSYPEIDSGKRYKCLTCPYVTNSKSQFLYHKQFHKPRGGQYTCTYCSYNVSKRHLLHQHLKVHGINITPQKQNGDVIDLDDLPDEMEEVSSGNTSFESQNFPDIPLVWVSKSGKFSKMFKCRYCPHVNLRKVNIQEHEKMHGQREKASTKGNEIEHHCSECNYVCNNAGVLSSHSKVHQGLYGEIHCLVDPTKSDDEQIRELSRFISYNAQQDIETINLDEDYEKIESSMDGINEQMEVSNEQSENNTDGLLFFCEHCPARFFKENEISIHSRFHMVRLYYKCEYCTYTARQKYHLLAHNKVHTYEYQERTKELQTAYNTSPNHPQPKIGAINQNGEIIWIVTEIPFRGSGEHLETDIENVITSTNSHKSSMNVPLSGTELFQQRSEAQQKQNAANALAAEKIIVRPNDHFPPAPLPVDPQFGTLIHGNPKFIYPTYLKNGRMKEKRYKCHKCPSAFEKREQYKVHLSLHGAKQRYKCDHCDYSVKYYANYVQHLKKHQMNADAHAARKSGDLSEDNEIENEEEEMNDVVPQLRSAKSISSRGSLKLSTADRQALMILNQRRGSASSSIKEQPPVEEKKLFWCASCPYTNYRKDAVDNHHKRHISVSGFTNNYTCEHCDYSVPQAHFLREHVKLHFTSNKINQPDGYMICDNLKLISTKVINNNEKRDESEMETTEKEESVIFEDHGVCANENRFSPSLNEEVLQRLNNNEGEKIFINKETGEVIEKAEKMEVDETVQEQVSSSEDDSCVKHEDDDVAPSQKNSDI
ncbi:hypothetical protein ILUMI_09284 [Ignelater luminosus]|uniref:C2H2-type domain-containing protein n=1 Tax=Ignelater luminosus TaxID=2038154 RepID=A0A8K0D4J8_IGNLU|nr:hypothetical protein ILUMI_09284 [Ignelater luminosus]